MAAMLQRHWAILAQVAAWLMGLVATFLIEPPLLWPRQPGAGLWVHLCQILVAIMVGLFFLDGPKGRRRRNRWRALAIGAALCGVASFVAYQVLFPVWTCGYRHETVMVGTNLSVLGQEFLAANPGAPCRLLIGAALGVTTDLWPASELITRYLILCGVYSLAALSFSAAVMATVAYTRAATGARQESLPE